MQTRTTWLLAVIPSAVLLLAASSQPLVDIYLPWEWTRNHHFAPGQKAEFSLPVPSDTVPGLHHAAGVEVKGFQKADVKDLPGVEIPDGTYVWVLLSQWTPAPDSLLRDCQMWMTGSDGRRYTVSNSILGPGPLDPNFDTWSACTPPDAKGPSLEWDIENHPDDPNMTTLNPGTPLPADYKKLTLAVLPHGVTPQSWHIAWDKPHFVTIDLPAPQEFVQP